MNTTVDRTSRVPLYFQLKQILLDNLDNGAWKPGDLVPSEQELQETFGLSRTTVRQALAELTFEGRFTRHRGQGTFVATRPIVHDPSERISITELMRRQAIEPVWQIRERGFVTPTPEVQEALALAPDEPAYFVELLLHANNEPIGRHLAYLPTAVIASLQPESASEEALRQFLRTLPDRPGVQISRTVQAVPARGVEARLLKLKAGEPILSIQVVYRDAAGQPLEHLSANYRGDRFKFQLNV